MSQQAIDHHVVPVFFLKRWARRLNGADKVTVFTWHATPGKLTASELIPEKTGYEQHLLSLTHPISGRTDHVEVCTMQQIDSDAANVVTKLLDSTPTLSPREYYILCVFMASLVLRDPDNVDQIRRVGSESILHSPTEDPEEYDALAEPGDPVSLIEFAEALDPGLAKDLGIRRFPAVIRDYANHLHQPQFASRGVLDFREYGHSLALSDRPVISTTESGITNFTDPDFLALPLNPQKAFVAFKSPITARCVLAQEFHRNRKTLLTVMNQSSCVQARERVFADSRRPQRFVANRFKRRYA